MASLLSTAKIAYRIDQISGNKYRLMTKSDCSCPNDVIWEFKIPIELQTLDFMLLKPVNGILCICGPLLSHISSVYLWNPLTNEFKTLPKPSVHLGYVAVSFGFGFVPDTNDYKVVRVLKKERKRDYLTEIYSLNRNSWKMVRDSCSSSDEIAGNERDLSVNGSVRFFLTYLNRLCSDISYDDGDFAVDLEKEVIIEADHGRKHYKEITWNNERDAIMLTFPEDDLVLCKYSQQYSYYSRSGCSTIFDFVGSVVSLDRDHEDLGY